MKILHAGCDLELFPLCRHPKPISRFSIRSNNAWVGSIYFTELSGGDEWVLELYPEIAATRGFIDKVWKSLSQHLALTIFRPTFNEKTAKS